MRKKTNVQKGWQRPGIKRLGTINEVAGAQGAGAQGAGTKT
jgi:hypothetical protein